MICVTSIMSSRFHRSGLFLPPWVPFGSSGIFRVQLPFRNFESGPDVKITANTRVHSCFAGLSMGDHWAPAIAQVAHEQLLKSCGAVVDEEHLVLGSPIYLGPRKGIILVFA